MTVSNHDNTDTATLSSARVLCHRMSYYVQSIRPVHISAYTRTYRTHSYAGIPGHTELHIPAYTGAYRTHTSVTIRTYPPLDLGLINIYQCIYPHTHTYSYTHVYIHTYHNISIHSVHIGHITHTQCCPAVGSHTDATPMSRQSHTGHLTRAHTWQCDRSKPMCSDLISTRPADTDQYGHT